MGDLAVWGPLVIAAATLVISGMTLWFVVTDRVRLNRRAAHANLSTHVARSIDFPGEGRCDVVDITNTGESTALVLTFSFGEVKRLIDAHGVPNPGDFAARFTMAPGQGFSLVLPPDVSQKAWAHFLYTDTSDHRFVHASWTPLFGEYGPEFEPTRWERFKRRITPPRYRALYPVGPGGAPAISLKQGPRMEAGIRKALELLPTDATVQMRNRTSSDFPHPD